MSIVPSHIPVPIQSQSQRYGQSTNCHTSVEDSLLAAALRDLLIVTDTAALCDPTHDKQTD